MSNKVIVRYGVEHGPDGANSLTQQVGLLRRDYMRAPSFSAVESEAFDALCSFRGRLGFVHKYADEVTVYRLKDE